MAYGTQGNSLHTVIFKNHFNTYICSMLVANTEYRIKVNTIVF